MHRRFGIKALVVPALLAGMLALAAACGNDDDNGNGVTDDANGNDDGAADAVTEITVDMHDNYFEPDEFTVEAGTSVTVTAVNEGAEIHNLAVRATEEEGQDFETDPIVEPGEEDTFEMTLNEPGEYVFECDYHLPEMVGTITVVE